MNRFQFELHPYNADGGEQPVEVVMCVSDAAARAKAGRMAKRNGGPVDLARAGAASWADRYMTTASPSEFHASGFCFERVA